MSKLDLDEISIPSGLDDAINRGVQQAVKEKQSMRKSNKGKKRLVGVAASIGLFFTIGVMNPSIASSVPFIENAFAQIQDKLTFSGNFSDYATSINQTVYDNGVGVTLSEIYCDGQSLYVSYQVNSEEPFQYINYDYDPVRDYDLTPEKAATIKNTQLMYAGYGKADFTAIPLDDSGVSGLEGEFIDEHNFVGVEKYDLTSLNMEVPDQFQYNITLRNLRVSGWSEDDIDQVLKGKWSFSIPVTVDQSTEVIEVNQFNEDGLGVESIAITPFELKIKTIHPKDTAVLNYYVSVYDAQGTPISMDSQKWEDTFSITTIPNYGLDTNTIDISLYKEILKPTGPDTFEHIANDELYRVTIRL